MAAAARRRSQESALLRGRGVPHASAVTSDDYRILALRSSGGVARASAFAAQSLGCTRRPAPSTSSSSWSRAEPDRQGTAPRASEEFCAERRRVQAEPTAQDARHRVPRALVRFKRHVRA
jgi:hypothetical protein